MSKSLAEKLTERELITVNENDQLLDAINMLVKYNIGAIPVINNNKKLVGIISERDIVKALSNYKNKDYSILLVNQLMTKTVISCEKEVLSDKLMELMKVMMISDSTSKRNAGDGETHSNHDPSDIESISVDEVYDLI